MSGNRGKDTAPEIKLRKALWAIDLKGYRLHRKGLPGRPDIAYGRQKIAIFLNGCFWHRCPNCDLSLPKTNTTFWKKKFEMNMMRDKRKVDELKQSGWVVLVIWECEVNRSLPECVSRVEKHVTSK